MTAVAAIEVLERLPTSAMSERDIARGYAGGPIVEPCVCGDVIVAASRFAGDVERAVAAHSESTAHQQWRARRGPA